jgi:hypothetical protein
LRNPRGIEIIHTRISAAHLLDALLSLPDMSEHKSILLLDPSDKMNVPGAINLLDTLRKIDIQDGMTPGEYHRRQSVMFLAHWMSLFVVPFISLTMTLGERLRSLAAYGYITAALYLECGTKAMTGALYADSQAIVKNIFFLVARSQLVDRDISLHLLFEGTDRLEELFGKARTTDHSRNFDVLQLSQKLAIGTILHAIFQAHPDVARPHKAIATSNRKGVDHRNPASVTGNCRVGDFEVLDEYNGGLDFGVSLLRHYFPRVTFKDLRKHFQQDNDKDRNLSCPNGFYVGHSHASQTQHDHLDDPLDDARSENEPSGPMRPPLPDPESGPTPVALALIQNRARANELTQNTSLTSSETGSDTDTDSLSDHRSCIRPSIEKQASNPPLPSTIMRYELPVAAASAEPEVDLAGADLESLLEQEEAAQTTAAGAASNPVPHLEIDGKKFLKSSLVPAFTSVPGDKRVIMRTLRSAGLTLEKLTGHNRREYRERIGDSNEDDGLKADDICAILVRCGDALVLAVVQINEFRLGPQKVPLTRITQKDLDTDPSARVYGYILDLVADDFDADLGAQQWLWTHAVVCLNRTAHSAGKVQYQNYMVDFPAWQMHPLAPEVVRYEISSGSSIPEQHRQSTTWVLETGKLQDSLHDAVREVAPDEGASTIMLLPVIERSDAFPYRYDGGKQAS